MPWPEPRHSAGRNQLLRKKLMYCSGIVLEIVDGIFKNLLNFILEKQNYPILRPNPEFLFRHLSLHRSSPATAAKPQASCAFSRLIPLLSVCRLTPVPCRLTPTQFFPPSEHNPILQPNLEFLFRHLSLHGSSPTTAAKPQASCISSRLFPSTVCLMPFAVCLLRLFAAIPPSLLHALPPFTFYQPPVTAAQPHVPCFLFPVPLRPVSPAGWRAVVTSHFLPATSYRGAAACHLPPVPWPVECAAYSTWPLPVTFYQPPATAALSRSDTVYNSDKAPPPAAASLRPVSVGCHATCLRPPRRTPAGSPSRRAPPKHRPSALPKHLP